MAIMAIPSIFTKKTTRMATRMGTKRGIKETPRRASNGQTLHLQMAKPFICSSWWPFWRVLLGGLSGWLLGGPSGWISRGPFLGDHLAWPLQMKPQEELPKRAPRKGIQKGHPEGPHGAPKKGHPGGNFLEGRTA